IVIAGNNIHDSGRYCTDTPYGRDGIFVGADNVTIEGNVFNNIDRYPAGKKGCNPATPDYMNVDHAIYVSGSSGVTIANNIFYNNGHGWSVHVYPHLSANLKIMNNTFAFQNPYRPGHIILGAPIQDAVIANNIFYQPTTAGIDVSYNSDQDVNVQVRNNITYGGTIAQIDVPSAGITFSNNYDNLDPKLVSPA